MYLSREDREECAHLVSRITLVLLIYFFIDIVVPGSRIGIYVSVILLVSTISQTRMFAKLRNRLTNSIFIGPSATLPIGNSIAKDRMDLLMALHDIKHYLDRSKAITDKKRQLYKTMTWRQQDIVRKATDYPKKLNRIDKCITENFKLLNDAHHLAVQRHKVTSIEMRQATEKSRTMRYNDHYRVIESLCHFARDWSSNIDEITPLLDYITRNIDANITDASNTCIIAPGSGLGRVSHHLATHRNFHSVISIEYSWLMILLNEFIYSKLSSSELSQGGHSYKIYPYLHNFSNHNRTEDQFRYLNVSQLETKPSNLEIKRKDFTNFDVPLHFQSKNEEVPQNVVIVTCFFIDTAENLMDYMDSINKMASQFSGKKIWINCGPLKYGTAAKIELSYEELKNLRTALGWRVVDELEEPKLMGYLTDLEGLWQGYYGVTMFTCETD